MKNLLLYADTIERHHQLLPFSEEEFWQIYNRKENQTIYNICENPYLPKELFERLYKDKINYLAINYLANNINLPHDMFWKFYNKQFELSLVQNTSTPSNILEKIYEKNLKNNKFDIISSELCENPNTPIYILQELFIKNKYSNELAKNFNLPIGMINTFYNKNNAELNNSLLSNNNLPIHMIRKLSKNHLNLFKWVINPNIPQDILYEIYTSCIDNRSIIARLAVNPSISKNLSEKISNLDYNVYEVAITNLVHNINVSEDIKQKIIDKTLKIKVFQ